jgi:hypothetical protein
MKQNGWIKRYILIWTYVRGTLQYDIICALILAFIFLVPRGCFIKKRTGPVLTPHLFSQNAASETAAVPPTDSDHETK